MTSNQLLIFRLAELMLEHELHVLPVDQLFDDEQIGDFVKSVQIDSPYQQLLMTGVLTESVKEEELFVSFTVEGYFHFILGEVIYLKTFQKNSDSLLLLMKKNRLKGISEGVEHCLIKEVEKGQYHRLFEIIDHGLPYSEYGVIPFSKALLSGNVEALLNDLFTKKTDSDFKLLLEVIHRFLVMGKTETIEEIFSVYSNLFANPDLEKSTFNSARLNIYFLNFQTEQKVLEIIQTIQKNTTNVFSGLNQKEKTQIFVDLNNILVNRGHLSESFHFAMHLNLHDVDEELLITHFYNFIYPLLELGEFEIAEKIFIKCKDQPQVNGVFLNWSGFIYQAWFELKSQDPIHLSKALQLYQEGSSLIDQEFGRYSLKKYENLENLGYTFGLKGDYENSLSQLDQAIRIVQKTYQNDCVYSLGNLYEMKAMTLFEMGKYSEALQLTFQSDQCKLLQISPQSPEMAWNYSDRSKIYAQIGDRSKAIDELKIALEIRQNSLGLENLLTIETQEELNVLLLK